MVNSEKTRVQGFKGSRGQVVNYSLFTNDYSLKKGGTMPLILRKIDRKTVQGEWFDRELFGQTLRLKIRPKNDTVTREIREEHKRHENGVDVYDDMAILDAQHDYLLESFEGIVDEEGKQIEVNLENKKSVLFMDVPLGEISNWVFVVNKAITLGVKVYQAVVKN
jgi:hypothetical protein